MNDGALAALRAMYGIVERPSESSSHVDYCAGDECNMTDEADDFTTVVPRGVAKRLDPEHFRRMREEGNEE